MNIYKNSSENVDFFFSVLKTETITILNKKSSFSKIMDVSHVTFAVKILNTHSHRMYLSVPIALLDHLFIFFLTTENRVQTSVKYQSINDEENRIHVRYGRDKKRPEFLGDNGLFVDFLCFTMHSPEATISAGWKGLAIHNLKYIFIEINSFLCFRGKIIVKDGHLSVTDVTVLKAEFIRQWKCVAKSL